jgi:hypothetical protein
MNDIREHMEVIGSDGEPVGTVDYMDGTDRIMLAKSHPASGGKHHVIPIDWVEYVDDGVHLSKSSLDVMRHWRTAV